MSRNLLRAAANKRAAGGGGGGGPAVFTPNFANVKFQMDMEQNPPTDLKGHALSFGGGAVRSSAWGARESTYSVSFNGGNAAYFYLNGGGLDLACGTSDFCVEFDLLLDKLTGEQWLVDFRQTNGVYPSLYMNGTSLRYFTNSADRITGDPGFTTGTRNFITLSRVAGVTRLFANGAQVGSDYADTNNYQGYWYSPIFGGPNVGTFSGRTLLGKMDNIRITIGEGVSSPPGIPSVPDPTS